MIAIKSMSEQHAHDCEVSIGSDPAELAGSSIASEKSDSHHTGPWWRGDEVTLRLVG